MFCYRKTANSEYSTINPLQTKKLGEAFAKKLLRSSTSKQAVVIGLVGDLGGGKTTFLQGFARGLGIKEKILSPTFIIMKRFKIPGQKNFKHLYHFDCYRINRVQEVASLNLKKIITTPDNIVVIEWIDKIKEILPKKLIMLNFQFIDQKTRKIDIREIN